MDDLVCDYCMKDIADGEEYIETESGVIYCDEDELLDDLEGDYFIRKYKGEA